MINWGILGLGKIAGKFAADLQLEKRSQLRAVASRSIEKANEFKKEFNASIAYGSYEDLINDPSVDVIYIATPHVFHYDWSKKCLNNKKAVLCEKPFAMKESEVLEMIQLAMEKKVFLMEALWTRFIPATQKVIDLIEEGAIGEVNIVQSDFGFKADFDPNKRLFNKNLGGGALLDIGIYPIYLSLLLFGYPEKVSAHAFIGETGVDHSIGMTFSYQQEAIASLHASLTTNTKTEALVYGSKGVLKMHSRFHHCEKITISDHDQNETTYAVPYQGNGYFHEIVEVVNCLLEGEIQSKKFPHQSSLNLIRLLDQVRAEVGLVYE